MSKVLNNLALKEHFDHYSQDKATYLDEVYNIFSNKNVLKTVTLQNKSRILATILHHNEKSMFVKLIPYIDLPEITKTCEILDAPRFIRQYEKKLESAKHANKKSIEHKINFAHELCEYNYNLSLSLGKLKLVKKWVQSIPKDKLEFKAIIYKTDLWRKLADLTHLHPERDFSLPWFQHFIFGKPAPEGTFTNACINLTIDNFYETYNKYYIPYETIRNKLSLEKTYNNSYQHEKIDNIKNTILEREQIDKIIWYIKELKTEQSESILEKRIEEFDDIINSNISYGTLIEMIMNIDNKILYDKLLKVTDDKMKSYKLNIAAPVVILGDASESMQIAIKTCAIITSLLCYITNAELNLFKNTNLHIEDPPKDVTSAISFAKNINASNSTAPVASLNYYYESKKEIKTFIMITDEEENTNLNGEFFSFHDKNIMFADMYHSYITEITPAKLIIISFSNLNKPARMENNLQSKLGDDFSKYVKVFKFNKICPDMNKLDAVFKYLESISEKKQDKQDMGFFYSLYTAIMGK